MRTAFVALLLLAAAGAAQAQTPPPVEVFGRLPMISDAAISPDGTHVALSHFDAQGRSSVGVVNLDTAQAVALPVAENEQLRAVGFANDRFVSYVVSRTFYPNDVLPPGASFNGHPRRVDFVRSGIVDITNNRSRILTINEESPWVDSGALMAPIEGDPNSGRLFGRGSSRGKIGVYRVDLTNGRVTGVTPQGTVDNTMGFELDEAGNAYARYDSDQHTNRWSIYTYDNGQPRLLREGVSEYGEPMSIAGLLPDGRIVVHDRLDNDNFHRLYILDRQTGETTPFFSRDGVDITGTHHDPWTRRIVGAAWSSERGGDVFFDEGLEAIRVRLDQLLAGDLHEIMSWSRDRRRFLLYVEHGLDGGGYYIFEPAGERFTRLGMRYPELANVSQGERQSITYRARDGVRIPAYLTYPAGDRRTNLPLVLLVHGGPHARDNFDFDWWAAFLASRGYLVLQPNYRGSTGYGDAWEDAGRRQWGKLMQTDVEDGVAALIRGGIVDASRVCIVGASYGGYAALAGATLTPDRYTCAASIAGVSDLERMLRTEERETGGSDSMTSDWWRDSIGDVERDRDDIRAVSPANLADRVHIPVLLIHGTDDTVVPIEQSRLMRDRLRAAGKDVRYVELSGDDHWLSDAATRIQMLREVESFLAQQLRPGGRVEVDDSGAQPAH